MQYLNKVSEQAAGDDRLEQQLGAAFLKMGDLEGQPGHSNLRDMDAARQSYARSIVILEPQVRANPGNPELQHLLTIATLRKAQLEESEEAQSQGFAQARQMAERQAAKNPGSVQAKSDLAEALLAETDTYSYCDCHGSADDVRRTADVRRAIGIRQEIVAKGTKTARARWELARAQMDLGSILMQGRDPRALTWFEDALKELNDLVREEPANVQYQRDRAQALGRSANSLGDNGRDEESVQRAREAVAVQQQLAGADPGNTAFRRDLIWDRIWLAQILRTAGSTSPEVLENFDRALAEAKSLAAAQPGNPDVQRQVASGLYMTGNYLSNSVGQRQAGVKDYREAETIYRALIRAHPGEKRYQRDLAGLLPELGRVVAVDAGGSAALTPQQESIAIWEKLCAAADAVVEDIRGLANARAAQADAFDSLSRKEDAIAQYLAAVSLYERALSRNPSSIVTQRSLAATYSGLSLVYESRSNFRTAVDTSLKALTLAEADYAAHPETDGATLSLWRILYALWSQEGDLGDFDGGIQAAQRCVEIAERYARLAPTNPDRLQRLRVSYNNLGVAFRRGAHRQESLAAKLKAAAVFDQFPVEKLNARIRYRIAEQYSHEIVGLRELEAQEAALPLCKKALAILEPLVQSDPNNEPYRQALQHAYYDLAQTSLQLDDVPSYLDNLDKMVRSSLEKPSGNSAFWKFEGDLKINIAFGQVLAAKSDSAAQSLHEALECLQKSRQLGRAAEASQKKNLTALAEAATADFYIAFVEERLGDLKTALEYSQEAQSYAKRIVAADPGTADYQEAFDQSNGAVARLQWLIDGSPRRPTPELAQGWEVYSEACTDHNDGEAGLAAAIKALEIDREVAARDPQADRRLAITGDLKQSGLAYLMVARRLTGTKREEALQKSRQSYAESRDLMTALQKVNALPANRVADLTAVAQSIANVDSRLAVMQTSKLAGR